jgi:localization factor PodJL
MTSGVLWNVKGIRPEVRQTAISAARRSGVSVGQWLNSVIADSAAEEVAWAAEANASPTSDNDVYEDEIAWHHGGELAGVKAQLDELRRRLGRIAPTEAAGGNVARAAYRPHPDDALANQLAQTIARLERQLDQLLAAPGGGENAGRRAPADRPVTPPRAAETSAAEPTDIDQALAEIAARMRALDGEGRASEPARRAEQPHSDAPAFSRLENQLRDITVQIESIRRPCGIEQEIAGLRVELADIRCALTEALPRRAVESLEIEVKALAERVDHLRLSDAGSASLAGIERGLAEVRTALGALTPAESLIGYDEAAQTLSRKIDALMASSQDPAALQQLEAAIALMRDMVSHVATNDALTQLADEVRALAAKVDRIANGGGTDSNAYTALEQRIALLAEALHDRNGVAQANPHALETTLSGLTDKLAAFEQAPRDVPALDRIEQRLAQLVERLEASEHRPGQLEAIERTLADRLANIEASLQTKTSARQAPAPARPPQQAATLPAVTVTPTVAPPLQPAEAPPAMAPVPATRGDAAPAADGLRHDAASTRTPIDPDLPPDHPLEPGIRTPRARVAVSAADRIADSEAALGAAKPPVIPDPAGKSNFIAAARRAAKAAALSQNDDARPATSAAGEPPRKLFTDRLRKLIIGAGVVLIAVGALHVAMSYFAKSPTESPPPLQTENSTPRGEAAPASQSDRSPSPGERSEHGPVGGAAEQPSPGRNITAAVPSSRTGNAIAEPTGTAVPALAEQPAVPEPASGILSPVLATATPAPAPAPVAPLQIVPELASPAQAPPQPDRLPAGVGAGLRTAALAGNPAAEYEIAVRYADRPGQEQDFAEAARWFERAANRGLAPAQFRLGGLYEKGIGVKKDLVTARRLYLAAAENGNGKAMHNLAVLHAEGIDGKPDYRVAAQWFRSAAERGIADSQYNLGVLYARGIGVEQNLAESYKWFTLAAAQGDKDAGKKRDDVAARLDPQSLIAARLAAQTFTPEAQPEEATTVKAPPGGWDGEAAEKPAKRKARTAPRKPVPARDTVTTR